MKKIILLCAVLSLLPASAALAKTGEGITIDGSLLAADETYKGSDAALGFGFGVSYGLGDMVRLGQGSLVLRGDIGVLRGSSENFYLELDSSRIPLFVGVRYILPLDLKPLDLYAEGGLELSRDKYEVAVPVFLPGFRAGFFAKSTISDTNLGVTPGFGAVLSLSDSFSLGLNARFHLITNTYLSFGLTAGYSF